MTDSKSSFERLKQLGAARSALLAAALVLLGMALDTAPQRWLRAQLFDGYQQLLPRQRSSSPAVVVAIDERSLATIGQWPWPRNRLGELIDKIAQAGPAAIGVDIFMPEPDRMSPRRVIESAPNVFPELLKQIRLLPDNDMLLADAIKGRPVVMAIAGNDEAPAADRPIRSAPLLMRGDQAGAAMIPAYAGVVRSRPEIEAAAAGLGLINGKPTERVVRRVPLLGRVGDQILPNLEVEMLRVAGNSPGVQVQLDAGGVRQVRVAQVAIPTDREGAVWLRYGTWDPGSAISAADVLRGRADPILLRHRLVLVGLTGLGLIDQPPTPLGRMPGIEIRAQLLENIFGAAWLVRPHAAPWIEGGLFMLMALGIVLRAPRGTPAQAFVLYGGMVLVIVLAGLLTFDLGALIDVATPAAGATLVFTVALGGTLAESQRQRRELTRRLQAEREAAAHLAGELETARRVQTGMLPESPGVLAGDSRIDLKAFMEPARSVGGDLYDFFLLDPRTLFVMIGDVSGKGLAAAMFMALIKSLCKSAVLRQPHALDKALAQAEDEIRRENPESLFVTMLVVCLNLDSGEFTFCNAGHDPLYGVRAGQAGPRRIDHGGRPPLCVLEDYPYPLGRDRLAPGEMLCMITDGITEATTASGQLYGHKRFEAVLTRACGGNPAAMIDALRKDVTEFAAGSEQSDDMSVVALRWNGSRSAADAA